jgi:hypothetical protein
MAAQPPSDDSQIAIWRSFVEARAAHSPLVTAATAAGIREAADKADISRENQIMMLAALGETKQAFEAANAALDHEVLQGWFLFTPATRNLRLDPAFLRLATRLGLIKYWRETGKRPDFCTDQARRSECSPQLVAALNS